MKVAIYARVSDDKKKSDGERRQDVNRQIDLIKEYLHNKNIIAFAIMMLISLGIYRYFIITYFDWRIDFIIIFLMGAISIILSKFAINYIDRKLKGVKKNESNKTPL